MLSFAALRRHVASSDPASTPGSPAWSKMPVVTSSSPLDPRPSSRPSSRRLRRRPFTTASQRATHPCSPINLHYLQQISQPSLQPYLPILVTFHSCNTSMQPYAFPLLQTHLCRNDSASAQGSLLRSPPPHPSSLPSPPVPSGLPRAHFPPLSTSTPLPLTPPFSPLPHTSLNPHPSEFRPSAP